MLFERIIPGGRDLPDVSRRGAAEENTREPGSLAVRAEQAAQYSEILRNNPRQARSKSGFAGLDGKSRPKPLSINVRRCT